MNKIIRANSLEYLPSLPDQSYDLIIADPMYDLSNELKEAYHEQFLRVCKGAIIVYMPPKNQWILPADQYLFWIKPISTKNTSKSYSRFVEMLFVYGRGTWNSKGHWSQYSNVFSDLVDSRIHRFRKPYSQTKRLILNHTNEGDNVLEPFGGSCVVAEVCRDLKRNSLTLEIENNLVLEAKQRLGL